MKTDSIVIYRSFVDAIEMISDPLERLKAFESMFDYGFDHIEEELTGSAGIALTLIKPQLDANFQRKMDGKKGGRPMKETDAQSGEESEDKAEQDEKNHRLSKQKTMVSKKKNHTYGNEKPNVNVNANVNANANVNVNEYLKGRSDSFIHAFKDFSDMRNKIKKPLTERAKQMLLNRLNDLSEDENTQIRILDQSTLNSWQNVYPLKEEKKEEKPPVYDDSGNMEMSEEEQRELMRLMGRSEM